MKEEMFDKKNCMKESFSKEFMSLKKWQKTRENDIESLEYRRDQEYIIVSHAIFHSTSRRRSITTIKVFHSCKKSKKAKVMTKSPQFFSRNAL